MKITKRLYTNQADLEKMIELTKKRPLSHILDFPSILDLQEMMGTAARQANTVLWETEVDELIGFAILDKYEQSAYLIMEIEPEQGAEFGNEMIAWGVERLRPLPPKRYELIASVREDDTDKSTLLLQNGFVQQTWGSVSLERPLQNPIPKPQIPVGFTIRSLAGEDEVPAWVAMHQAAFGTQNMTIDERLAMMHTPDYDPALDLVVEAPNGELAAYCNCIISSAENEVSGRKLGYTDPVATHPRYRRQGLATALILHGLQLLHARGIQTASLGTSSRNNAMQKTAEATGFCVVRKKNFFAKEIGTENV